MKNQNLQYWDFSRFFSLFAFNVHDCMTDQWERDWWCDVDWPIQPLCKGLGNIRYFQVLINGQLHFKRLDFFLTQLINLWTIKKETWLDQLVTRLGMMSKYGEFVVLLYYGEQYTFDSQIFKVLWESIAQIHGEMIKVTTATKLTHARSRFPVSPLKSGEDRRF